MYLKKLLICLAFTCEDRSDSFKLFTISVTGHDFLYFSGLILGCIRMDLLLLGAVCGDSSHLFVSDMKTENLGWRRESKRGTRQVLRFLSSQTENSSWLHNRNLGPHSNVATKTRPEAVY